MKVLGHQILMELYGCEHAILIDADLLKQRLVMVATEAGATVVDSVFHGFNPHGVSGAIVIAESHITVHTWPEFNYAAIDIFTCGETIDTRRIMVQLIEAFAARKHRSLSFDRGIDPNETKDTSP
jgi:S-adenosylmethionine decarboxylase